MTMRKALKNRKGNRATFRGMFTRIGTKPGYAGVAYTVLLTDITDAQGQPVCDHLWFSLTKGFEAADLQPGDLVEFDARVTKYRKGYAGGRPDVDRPLSYDYRLSRPTKVKNLTRTPRKPTAKTLPMAPKELEGPPPREHSMQDKEL